MHARNALGNGQAQAAAGHRRTAVLRAAVEALQHALALIGRNARTAIVHHQRQVAGLRLQLHVHHAALRGVFDSVVDQVAQQDLQGLGLAGHAGMLRLGGQRQPQVHAALLSRRRRVGHGLARQIGQHHGLGRSACGGLRLLAGQDQQLLDQARGAVYAAGQALHGQHACAGVAGALQALHLQLERGQRRAQLVRGVGHEMLLRLEGMLHARQQAIEFTHQGLQLAGQAGVADGHQVIDLAPRQLAAHALHGREQAAYGPPHGQGQQRRHRRQRQQRTQRERARHGAARRHVLRNLDDLRARLQRKHAVGGAARLHLGEAQHRDLRQRDAHGGLEDTQALVGPDLDDELVVLVFGARTAAGPRIGRQAGAQRERGLLHLVVEQRVGLRQRMTVGQHALDQGGDGDGGQQEHQQPQAQRRGTAQDAHLGTM